MADAHRRDTARRLDLRDTFSETANASVCCCRLPSVAPWRISVSRSPAGCRQPELHHRARRHRRCHRAVRHPHCSYLPRFPGEDQARPVTRLGLSRRPAAFVLALGEARRAPYCALCAHLAVGRRGPTRRHRGRRLLQRQHRRAQRHPAFALESHLEHGVRRPGLLRWPQRCHARRSAVLPFLRLHLYPLVPAPPRVPRHLPPQSNRGQNHRRTRCAASSNAASGHADLLPRLSPQSARASSSLTSAIYWSAPRNCGLKLVTAFEEKFGITPLEGYGCTEMGPVISVNTPPPEAGSNRPKGRLSPRQCGPPHPGVLPRASCIPIRSSLCLWAKRVCLLVKGPSLMVGYLGDPVRTARALHDGFYITADLATFDEDGFLYLIDRLARFSKVGGEMVPHLKIEEELARGSRRWRVSRGGCARREARRAPGCALHALIRSRRHKWWRI